MSRLSFLVIFFVLFSVGYAHAYENGDFQFWNTDVEEFKINKDSKIAVEEEFRWGNDAREFYYNHYDVGFLHNMTDYLNLGAGYRQIYELKNRKFKLEQEPYVTATLLWKWNGCDFEDRNRGEYRHFDYQADSWRYRNKITMKLPWKITKLKIRPYLSDEMLFGFGGTAQFNMNRFSSGVSMNLTKNVKAEVYYMLQDSKSAGIWTGANILGTKFKISF